MVDVSPAPALLDLIDDPNDLTVRNAIPAGTTYKRPLGLKDINTPGAVEGDPDTYDDVDMSDFDSVDWVFECTFRLSPEAEGAPLCSGTVEWTDSSIGRAGLTIDFEDCEALQGAPEGGSWEVRITNEVLGERYSLWYGEWEPRLAVVRDDT